MGRGCAGYCSPRCLHCTRALASFFRDIEPDLEVAAIIDGCSRMGALFRVVVPLSASGVSTAAILALVDILIAVFQERVLGGLTAGGVKG